MGKEIWRSAVGYEGRYEVSDRGQVRSLVTTNGFRRAPLVLRARVHPKTGYVEVHISPYRCGSPANQSVHLLVLYTFVGPRPSGMQCHHIDSDRANNRLSNLEWVTTQENVQRSSLCVLCREDIIEIRSSPEPHKAMSLRYGVTRECIRLIRLGRVWSNVPS